MKHNFFLFVSFMFDNQSKNLSSYFLFVKEHIFAYPTIFFSSLSFNFVYKWWWVMRVYQVFVHSSIWKPEIKKSVVVYFRHRWMKNQVNRMTANKDHRQSLRIINMSHGKLTHILDFIKLLALNIDER